jgi:hypothetical protein
MHDVMDTAMKIREVSKKGDPARGQESVIDIVSVQETAPGTIICPCAKAQPPCDLTRLKRRKFFLSSLLCSLLAFFFPSSVFGTRI